MLNKGFAALAAVALVAGSSAAVAQTAQPLSLSNAPAARAGAPVQDAGDLDSRRGIGIYIIGAVVLGLIIWGALEIFDDGDSESP